MLGFPPDSHWASCAHTPSGTEPPEPESPEPESPDPESPEPPEPESPEPPDPEPPEPELLEPEDPEVLGWGCGAGRSAVPTSTIRSCGSVVTSTLTCLVDSTSPSASTWAMV